MKRKMFGFLSVFFSLGLVFALTSCTKYTIDFDEDGGTEVTNIQFKKGEVVEAPTAPTKDGLVFGGWFTDQLCTKPFKFGQEMPEGDILLFAKWNSRLTFNTNGGEELAPIESTPKLPVELPTPVRTGYVFGGWYKDAEFTTEQSFVMPAKNATIYAKWLKKDPNTSIKLGGWLDNDSVYDVATENDGIKFTATAGKGEWSYVYAPINLDLYTKNYNTVVITLQGTKDSEALLKVQFGKQANGNDDIVPTETKVKLTGEVQTVEWVLPTESLTANGNSKFMIFLNGGKAGASETPEYVKVKDLTVYRTVPEAEAGKEAAIFFDSNGGSVVDAIYATKGASVSEPDAPTKDGFVFRGWYSDAKLETAYTFDKMPNDAITLYAKWEEGVDLLAGKFKEGNTNTYDIKKENGVLTLKKLAAGGEWDYAETEANGEKLLGWLKLRIVVNGTAGKKVLVKVNNNYETWVDLTGEDKVVEIDLSKYSIDKANKGILFFVEGGTAGPSTEVTFKAMELLEAAPIPTSHDILNTIVGDEDHSVELKDAVLSVKKLKGGAWESATSNFDVNKLKGMKYLKTSFKGPQGKNIIFKINDQVEHRITCTGEVQYVELPFNLAAINAERSALYIMAGADVEGVSEVYEIYTLEFANYHNELNVIGTFTATEQCTATFENGKLTVAKTKGGAYESIRSSVLADQLFGMRFLKVEVQGPEGKNIIFKINDKLETRHTCTGNKDTLVIPFNLDLGANVTNTALIVMPGADADGASGDFVITKLEFTKYLDPVHLLDSWYLNKTQDPVMELVNENGILTVKKTSADPSAEWESIKKDLTDMDLANITQVVLKVKGTEGDKILFKVNDQYERWVTCTGEVQYIVWDLPEGAKLNPEKPFIIFPNAGVKAVSGVFTISELYFR